MGTGSPCPGPTNFKDKAAQTTWQESERRWISSAGIYRTTPLHREWWLPSLWFHKQQKSCLKTNVHTPTPLQELIPICTSHPLRTGTAFPTPERLTRWGRTDLAGGKEIHFWKVGWDAHLAHHATTDSYGKGDGTISWHSWQSHCSGNRAKLDATAKLNQEQLKTEHQAELLQKAGMCSPHIWCSDMWSSNHAHQPSMLTANPLGYFPVHHGAHYYNRGFNSNSVLLGLSPVARTRGQGKHRSLKKPLSELCSSQWSASRIMPGQLSLALYKQSRSHLQLKIKDGSPFCFNQPLLPSHCSSRCPNRPTLAQAWWGEPLQGAQSQSKPLTKPSLARPSPDGGGGMAQGRTSMEMSSAAELSPRAGPSPAWRAGWAEGRLSCWGCQEHTKSDVQTMLFPKATTEGLSVLKNTQVLGTISDTYFHNTGTQIIFRYWQAEECCSAAALQKCPEGTQGFSKSLWRSTIWTASSAPQRITKKPKCSGSYFSRLHFHTRTWRTRGQGKHRSTSVSQTLLSESIPPALYQTILQPPHLQARVNLFGLHSKK